MCSINKETKKTIIAIIVEMISLYFLHSFYSLHKALTILLLSFFILSLIIVTWKILSLMIFVTYDCTAFVYLRKICPYFLLIIYFIFLSI